MLFLRGTQSHATAKGEEERRGLMEREEKRCQRLCMGEETFSEKWAFHFGKQHQMERKKGVS